MSKDNSHIIIIGAPGCGKGTQAQSLVDAFRLLHLSTGNLFRTKYATLNDATRKGKALIDKGNFFSTEIACQMIEDFLEENYDAKGIVYDGFPRNLEQAVYFLENISAKPIVIELLAEENILTKRLLERSKTEHRADDSSTQIIEKRMQLYREVTQPLSAFFSEKGLLHKVDGDRDINKISEDIISIVQKHIDK